MLRSVDFSRDGVGSASVGTYVTDAASRAAFLKYAVDRTRTRGNPVDLPPNAAPSGGLGALGAFTRERTVDGNPVFEDLSVTATIAAAPARDEQLTAFALRSTVIPCPQGGFGEVMEVVEGSGPAEVTIDSRLASADAAGAIPATRFSFDGCTGTGTEGTDTVAVTLSLDATGAAVRSVDTRFQVRPGEGVQRERLSYRARPAGGPQRWAASPAPPTWRPSPGRAAERLPFRRRAPRISPLGTGRRSGAALHPSPGGRPQRRR